MARRIKVSSVILNMRTHPHNPDIYANLIADLFDRRRPVKIHGDRYGLISLIHRDPTDNGFVSGTITTFVKVEFDGNWFDAENMKPATVDDVSQVVIPENLYPNSATFYFEYDIRKHFLYVQSYSDGKVLSARQAQNLFRGLTEDAKIIDKYGKIHVTIKQSSDGLSKLFSLKIIKKISITIYKPNPDIFSDSFEADVEAALAAANSQSITITYDAEPRDSLIPTREIREISQAALENGYVKVEGRDETGRVARSTEQMPAELHDKYDPENTAERTAFRGLIPRW